MAISVVFLALFLRSVSPGDVLASLREVNPLFLLPAVALYFVGTLVRAVRWQRLFPGRPLSVRLLFRTLLIGLMVNDVLPGRVGELARVFLLSRNASVPVGVSVATIVAERVLDGIALTAILGAGVLLSGVGGWLLQLALVSTLLFAVAAAGLVWAALVPGPARWLGYRLAALAPATLAVRLRTVVDGVLDGLRGVTNPVVAVQVIGLSLIAWSIEASMYVVIMEGFHLPGGMAAGLMGASVANLATLVPSSPGYVGTFDFALQSVLVGVFGAPSAEATSYTLVVHAALLVPVVLVGLFFLWRENLTLPELSRRPPPDLHADLSRVRGRGAP
jgi:hypothetical protein